MDSSILKKASEFLGAKTKNRHWKIIVTALAGVVVLSTAYILSKPAQTLVNKTYCGMEEHVHTEECYELELICEHGGAGTEGAQGQENGDAAPMGSGEGTAPEQNEGTGSETPAEGSEEGTGSEAPAEGSEEGTGSEASAEGSEEGTGSEAPAEGSEEGTGSEAPAEGDAGNTDAGDDFVMTAAESGKHQHDESCYKEESTLICGLEEAEGHKHTENCKEVVESQELVCGLEEREGHTHIDACKETKEVKELTCGQEEGEAHTHTDECYQTNTVEEIVCGMEEQEGHTHTDACYQTVSRTTENIVCGMEEQEGHTHTDACYETVSKLICGYEAVGTAENGEGTGESTEPTGSEEPSESTEPTGSEEPSESTEPTGSEEPSESTEPTGSEEPSESTEPTGSEEPAAPAEGDTQPEAGSGDEAPAAGGEGQTSVSSGDAAVEGHVHTEECYALVLKCRTEEHAHEDKCYDETYCGIEGHTHCEECYGEEDELICARYEHKHEANCYKEPHCGITVHIHGQDCHDEEGVLVCDMEEHIHEDECYISNIYYCTERIHVHDNDCYDLNGKLLCGSADYVAHVHTEACYNKNERLICTLKETEGLKGEEGTEGTEGSESTEESESEEGTESAESTEPVVLHTHESECYGIRGVLICGQTELLLHEHEEESCRIEPSEKWIDTVSAVAYCGIPAHIHRDGCEDEDGNQVCGIEEHIHTDKCFEEPGYGCIAGIHIHEAECYDADGSLQCGLADYVLHSHSEKCYGLDGKLLCTLPEIPVHVHGEECYASLSGETEGESGEAEGTAEGSEPVLICTIAETTPHEHSDACRDADGRYICGRLQVAEHIHTDDCAVDAAGIIVTQSYKGEDFIITATYNKKDANLPAEAKFFAQRITPEENEEYYAERAAQYQEMQGEDEESTMQALLKVGFAVDGVEVEPEAPVTIKIQFLDENGLADGSPVTVVHFGEEGTERLTGSDAEKNGTTFEMDSFSEIALGWKVQPKTVQVDKEFNYESENFNINFHVEGDAILPTEEEIQKAKEEAGEPLDGAEGEEPAPIDGDAVVTNDDLVPVVKPMEETTEQYEAAVSYVEEIGTEDEVLDLQVLSYALTYEGAKLDLTGCKVTVEVTPTDALVEYAQEGIDEGISIDGPAAEEGSENSAETDEENEEHGDVYMIAVDSESEIPQTVGDVLVAEGGKMTYEMTAEGTDNVTTVLTTSQANPEFEVQYYAYIDVVSHDGNRYKKETGRKTNNEGKTTIYYNELQVIDTTGGELPQNGVQNPTVKQIYVNVDDSKSGEYGTIITDKVLKEMYKANQYHYIEAPSLLYFDTLVKNSNYNLSAVWVHTHKSSCYGSDGKPNCEAVKGHSENCYVNNTLNCTYEAEKAGNWIRYEGDTVANLHFTNRISTAEGKPNYILITGKTVIRLVHEVSQDNPVFDAAFYDYNIGDGKVYKSAADAAAGKNGTDTTSVNGDTGTWFMNTVEKGINNPQNYIGKSGTKFAFGNDNTGTGLGQEKWKENLLNKANTKQNGGTDTFKGCTFGLVTKLSADGKIVYDEGLAVPNLFNEDGEPIGKVTYKDEYSLQFERRGDTYTLEKVLVGDAKTNNDKTTVAERTAVPSADRLKYFNNPRYTKNSAIHYHIWTNNFWPMDSVASFGGKSNDMKWGLYANYTGKTRNYGVNSSGTNLPLPPGDDGLNHNSNFGMHYEVKFELDGDYVGPLEYYFFGDDDMWVFLSEENTDGSYEEGELVCDIGGVHSSVGEYVNLWDYIDKGTTGKYKLSFFYTERGESGSSCWMQFTLPSVSSIPLKQDTGEIRIEKEVSGTTTNNQDEEFGFEIQFNKKNGESLEDDYSYSKYDKDGNFLSQDILIWNGARFTLKADEYIVVSLLPIDTKYTIEEVGPVEVERDEGGKNVYDGNGQLQWKVKSDNPYIPGITVGKYQYDENGEIVRDEQGNPIWESSETEMNSVVTGTVEKGKVVTVHYKNSQKFALPETGGSGMAVVYALAGAGCILFSAGLMYRKKFRERRA